MQTVVYDFQRTLLTGNQASLIVWLTACSSLLVQPVFPGEPVLAASSVHAKLQIRTVASPL